MQRSVSNQVRPAVPGSGATGSKAQLATLPHSRQPILTETKLRPADGYTSGNLTAGLGTGTA